MKIAILGTGMVGRTLAEKLVSLGHDVAMGTRAPSATSGRADAGPWGAPSFADWIAANPKVALRTFADAARHGELLINAASGAAALDILRSAGAEALGDKVMIDISNPLDFSKGMPPSLFVSNTDSLAEQLQRAFPRLKLVKALNTISAPLMVNPGALADGAHTSFVSGNDAAAKGQVVSFLREQFGWKDVLDLGDVTTARGTEQYLPLWLRMWGALQTPMFSIQVVR